MMIIGASGNVTTPTVCALQRQSVMTPEYAVTKRQSVREVLNGMIHNGTK